MEHTFFSSDQLIDFHTHRAKCSARQDVLEIISSPMAMDQNVFTLERHPWHIVGQMTEAEVNLFKSQLMHANCLGIGEIGLDKIKGAPLEEQISTLRGLLKVAQQEQKSVVIHCVKSFGDLIQLKKEFSGVPKWAIHGFNKNEELAKQLIDQGFYLSINTAKVSHSKKLIEVIPLERLFLETDNSSESIEDNYIRTAEILEIELDDLKVRIARNAQQFFEHG